MENEDIGVAAYSNEIDRLLSRYGLPADTVEIVDSIQSWCRDHGEAEPNPFRAGKTFHGPPPRILLARVVTPDIIGSVTGRMLVSRGLKAFFEKTLGLGEDGTLFLRHLVLHEIGHALGIQDEDKCDAWAFEEFDKLAAEGFYVHEGN